MMKTPALPGSFLQLDPDALPPAPDAWPAPPHFSLDLALARWAVMNPDQARAHWALLVDAVWAADFALVRSESGFRVGLSLASPDGSMETPWDAELAAVSKAQRPALLMERVINEVSEVLANPMRFESRWSRAWRNSQRTLEFLGAPAVRIEESLDLNLTVISGPRPVESLLGLCARAKQGSILFLSPGGESFLVQRFGRLSVETDYSPFPRPVLKPLVEHLNAIETGPVQWVWPGEREPWPRLRAQRTATAPARSNIPEEELGRLVIAHWQQAKGNARLQWKPGAKDTAFQ